MSDAASLQAGRRCLFTTTETTKTTGKRQHGVSLELVVSLGGREKKRKTHVAFFNVVLVVYVVV